MIKLAALLCVVASVVPAVAEEHLPSSLRMRAPRVVQVADAAPAAPPAASDPDAVAPPTGDDGKIEVISVTESTIEHELFTGRAPVTVVTRADLAASGRSSLGDILQALPAQSNAGNAQTNLGGDGTSRVNLRGLGASRTLVLLNGRRIVNGGAGVDTSVDIDAIPVPIIERVEILKDGASAIYGADAVGGVVNLITTRRCSASTVPGSMTSEPTRATRPTCRAAARTRAARRAASRCASSARTASARTTTATTPATSRTHRARSIATSSSTCSAATMSARAPARPRCSSASTTCSMRRRRWSTTPSPPTRTRRPTTSSGAWRMSG